MPTLQRPQAENKYLDEFNFLYELVNTYTKKLGIDNKLFYFLVQRKVKGMQLLQGFVYHHDGLSSSKALFNAYRKETEMHNIAPYLASFARLLAAIYKKACTKMGEEKASIVFHNAYDEVKKNYTTEPYLEGYIPSRALGSSSSSSSSSAFNINVMENLLNYLIQDVIEKGITPAQKRIEEGKKKLSPEEMKRRVKAIYLQALGPLGGKQLEKLGEDLNKEKIFKQIHEWEKKGILDKGKARNLENKIRQVYGLPVIEEKAKKVRDFFGVEKEVKQNDI
jgi:hypothetical protein